MSDVQTSYVGDLVEMCGRLHDSSRRLDEVYWSQQSAKLPQGARRRIQQADELSSALLHMERVVQRMHARTAVNPPAPWEVRP